MKRFGRLLTSRSWEPMRVRRGMEQRQNKRAGETGNPRENTATRDLPMWEASSLTTTPPRTYRMKWRDDNRSGITLGRRPSWRTVVFVGNLGGSVVDGFAHLLGMAQRSRLRMLGELGSNGSGLHSWASGFASTTGSSWISRRAQLTYNLEIFWRGRGRLPDAFLLTLTRDVELLMSAQKSEDGVGGMTELPGFLAPSAGSLRTLPEVTAVDIALRVVRLSAQEHGWQFHLKEIQVADDFLCYRSNEDCSEWKRTTPPGIEPGSPQSQTSALPAGPPRTRQTKKPHRWSVGFPVISRFPARTFRRCSILTSLTLTGSQDIAAQMFPLSTRALAWNHTVHSAHVSSISQVVRQHSQEEQEAVSGARVVPRASTGANEVNIQPNTCRDACLMAYRPSCYLSAQPTLLQLAVSLPGYTQEHDKMFYTYVQDHQERGVLGGGGRAMLRGPGRAQIATLNIEVLRADEGEAKLSTEDRRNARGGGVNGRSPRKHADQRHRPARSPHATPLGIEPGSPRWEAVRLTTEPPRDPTWRLCFIDLVNPGPGWSYGSTARFPLRRTGFDSRGGHSRIFASGNRTERCHWSASFLWVLPFPPPLHSGATPYSPHFIFIGSQDLDVKSRPNLSIPLPVRAIRSYLVRHWNVTCLLLSERHPVGTWIVYLRKTHPEAPFTKELRRSWEYSGRQFRLMEWRRPRSSAGIKGRRKGASSGTIPTCENPGGTWPGIEPVDLCAGVEPVDKETARGTELSDFDKGVIVGCHLSGLSSQAIARKVNRPKSTVAFVLRKWKVGGHCANAARSGRPPILTDRNRRSLKHRIVKNRTQPMATIRREFHAATGESVSIGTLCTEAHRFGYFGRAAAHKPHITTNNKAR
ncbi:hypothetical protein PR048_006907 [Dryococelus australis]|uniref:Tc3 transposase DNA binding domain-containing protein n=1 Tax=Dryococelus australis TaxID=614101 RepID=A0ABQ9ICU2_9NEOP|nr:hypothetical protein PR048_006907 [Dryococelus australis]